MKRKHLLLIVSALITLLVIYLYLLHFADKLSEMTNYFVGLGVFPVVLGVVIGFIGATYFAVKDKQKFIKYYYFPVVCGLASLILVVYSIMIMSI